MSVSLAGNPAVTGMLPLPGRHMDVLDVSSTGLSELPETFPQDMSFMDLYMVRRRTCWCTAVLVSGCVLTVVALCA